MVNWNLVGYARVSTDDQNLDLQMRALHAAGVREAAIYREHVSGVGKRRPQLQDCMKILRPGDVLVIWKRDRLGRDLIEVVKMADELRRRQVELRSLTEQIDTTSAYGKFFFHVIAAFAQLERDLISERTKAGLAAARARGKLPGRRPSLTPEQWLYAGDRFRENKSIRMVHQDPDFRALGWKDGTIPSKSALALYRGQMLERAPYPAQWERYLGTGATK